MESNVLQEKRRRYLESMQVVGDVVRPPEPPFVPCRGCKVEVRALWLEYPKGHWLQLQDCEQCSEEAASLIRTEIEPGPSSIEKLFGGAKALDFTFEKFRAETPSQIDALKVCRSFSPILDNLYIWGRCGTGKTHLACATVAAAKDADMLVECFKPSSFLRSVRMKEAREHEAILKRYVDADIFVLDDLGIGAATEFAVEAFYELVDKRDMARKNGLIVTSNLSLDQLAEKLQDDRLTSRLDGMCRIIKIEGPDARGRRP